MVPGHIHSIDLVRIRKCDGACCRESPRFPNADKSDCRYHDEEGCQLMRGTPVPNEMSVIFPDRTAADVFEETCVNWPHNTETPRLGKTGNCCWQWIDGN